MASDFDIEAFTELYLEWLHTEDEERPGSPVEQQLLQQYRQAWELGGRYPRHDVLFFIGSTATSDAAPIVWQALHFDDELLVAGALHAAFLLLRKYPALAETDVVTALKKVVEEGPPRIRSLALGILDRPRLEGLDPWLRDLAERTEDDDVRMTAYRILLRTGYEPAKQALFADIRENPDHFGWAMDLFGYRSVLNLTGAEEQELREMLQRYVDNTRTMIVEGKRRPPVSVVGALARDGLAIGDPATEAISQYARTAEETKDRRQAVEAIAAIGTPRARELLAELASLTEPADVAERAGELLERD